MKCIIVVSVLLLFACSPQKRCAQALKTVEKYCGKILDTTIVDTTIYHLVHRDTIIFHAADSFLASIKNPCDESGKLKLINKIVKGKRGSAKIKTQGDSLVVNVVCDELMDRITLQDKVIDHYRTMTITNAYVKPTELTFWQKTGNWLRDSMAIIGIAAIIVLILRLR